MAKLSRAEWPIVLTLAAINFTHVLDFVIIMPLGKRLMAELGMTDSQFGHVISVYGMAAAIAGVIFATFADRFDRKRSLLAIYVGFTVATVACGIARTYPEMLAARFFAGAFGGIASSSLMAIIADTFEDRRRGTATGIVMSAFAIASIAGLPIGLMLANRFGRGMPFFAVAALSVVIGIVAVWSLPSVRGHMNHGSTLPSYRRLWNAARDPGHVRSFVFMFFVVLGTFTIIPYIAPYLETNCGQSQDDIPFVYSVAGLFTLVSTIVVGRLTDRVGKRPVFLTVAAGSIVMTLIMTHLPSISLGLAIVVTTGFMIFASARMVPAQALMLAAADPKSRGAFTNLNSAVSHCGTGLAPLLGGLFIGRDEHNLMTGYGHAGLLASMFAIVAMLLCLRVRRPTQPT